MPQKSSSKSPPVRPARKTPNADGSVMHVRYSKKVTARICQRIARGDVWYKIANTDGLPSYDTLYQWLRKHPDFAEDFAQAREIAADLRADKVLVVAEEATAATVQRDRLHVGALQWHASKAAPKRYGSRPGDDGEPEGEPRRLIIEVRRFETAYRPDGSAYTREILPDGEEHKR
ncbi:MAG: hypothetical protein ACREE0_14055 [Phenylobacterium sp.]